MDTIAYKNTTVATVKNYSEDYIKALETKLASNSRGNIDILLTSDWPLGKMTFVRQNLHPFKHGQLWQQQQVQPNKRYKNWRRIGSEGIARLAKACAPRYHFCGIELAHFETSLQIIINNNNSSDNSQQIAITRFMSLSNVAESNQKEDKWLYAAGLTPLKQMNEEQRQAIPAMLRIHHLTLSFLNQH